MSILGRITRWIERPCAETEGCVCPDCAGKRQQAMSRRHFLGALGLIAATPLIVRLDSLSVLGAPTLPAWNAVGAGGVLTMEMILNAIAHVKNQPFTPHTFILPARLSLPLPDPAASRWTGKQAVWRA